MMNNEKQHDRESSQAAIKETSVQEWRFIADEEADGLRADVYLTAMLTELSRSRIKSLMKNGDILINGLRVKSGKRIEEGDVLFCRIEDPVQMHMEAVPMDLSIIYEDDCLLVINKEPGLVVHPAPGNEHRTLVHGLLAYCQDLSGINGILRPGIVHRLDKDTSGLLVVAKNDTTHRDLALQMQNGTVTRRYLAVVWGIISEPAGLIDAPIQRDPKDRKKMAAIPGGKEARTSYLVLDRLSDKTALRCDLHTGRTHQIRVHMQMLGYPVVGDPTYGRRKDDSRWSRQVLHAWQLGFRHPRTGAEMLLSAEPPEDFLRLLEDEHAKTTLEALDAARTIGSI